MDSLDLALWSKAEEVIAMGLTEATHEVYSGCFRQCYFLLDPAERRGRTGNGESLRPVGVAKKVRASGSTPIPVSIWARMNWNGPSVRRNEGQGPSSNGNGRH
jgi:hypothetical protein